ncbi:MAG: tRNA (adenosine(37)-N6)-threonylcarbamoyltransferase complex dimerization subunit type 1 TsaB [Acidimicrobiales bacterium]
MDVRVILLAIETATDLVGAAVLGPDGGVVERSHVGGRAHAELLAPAIEEACALAGCVLGDVDALAVDVGPGLFTGLRVGVATAKALGQALGLGVLGVTSLDVLAAGARELAGPERASRVVAVVDARRHEVFAAAFAFGEDGASGPVDPADVCEDRPEALSPEALVAWLDVLTSDGPVLVVGDGAVRYLEMLAPRPGVDCGLASEVSAPSTAALARLAARRLAGGSAPTAPGDIVPDYRRHADARINWEERAPQRTAVRPAADGP